MKIIATGVRPEELDALRHLQVDVLGATAFEPTENPDGTFDVLIEFPDP